MVRFFTITTLGLAALVAANAGPILGPVQTQIGGVNGLTNNYITSGCSGAGPCTAGSTGAFSEKNYGADLFSGAAVAAQPSTTTLNDSANGVTFSMIQDGGSGRTANNFWQESSNNGSSMITIPVGIFGVSDVWTMLNSELGAIDPARDATVIFNFGSTSNATTGLNSVKVKPMNTTSPSSAPAIGIIRNAVDCSSGTGCTGTAAGQTNGAVGTPLASSVPANTTLNGSPASGVTVYTNNLYTSAYLTATGAYTNTAGNAVLDDQGFVFSGSLLTTAQSSYLVSIQIFDPTTVNGSGLGLSAVTVDSATPEPSTVFLFISGLGLLGFGRLRRS